MNLTSKRILNGLAVCAGAFALTASAVTTWVSDSFEAPDGADGQAIMLYKAAQYGQGLQSNYLWVADADDASKLVASNRTYAANSPIPEAADNLILQLDTEGKTLTRYVDIDANETALVTNSVPFSATNTVYVDTLIKFVISEDPPPITDPDVKVAVFVNAESNLVVYHRVYTNLTASTTTNSVIATAQAIDPAKWYRLTIEMGEDPVYEVPACQVWLDGGALTNANAYGAEGQDRSWFLLAKDDTELTQISFQGTGAIDEFVVADAYAPFGGDMAVKLTLTWAEADIGLFTVKQNGTPVVRDAQIATGSAIEVVANDWHELASISGSGITIAETDGNDGWYTEAGVANDSLLTNFVGTVTADGPGLTATIDVRQFTGTLPASTGLEGVSASDLAAWAVFNKYSLAEVVAGGVPYYNAFLLDVPAGTDDTISITSIAVDGTTVTIKVAATDGVDLGAINGTLKVVTSNTLPISGTPTNIAFGATEGGVATIVIPNSGKFIKATVE